MLPPLRRLAGRTLSTVGRSSSRQGLLSLGGGNVPVHATTNSRALSRNYSSIQSRSYGARIPGAAFYSTDTRKDYQDEHEQLRSVIDSGASNPGTSGAPTGLFGEPALRTPFDFVFIAEDTKYRAQALVERISRAHRSGNNSRDMQQAVRNLDRLSDLLCKTIDLAEFLRTAHPDQDWREASEMAHGVLVNYMNELNTNVDMYLTLKAVVGDATLYSSLTQEGQRVADMYLADFEKSAIHLPDKQREQFVALSSDVLQLSTAFSQGLIDGPGFLKEDRPPTEIPMDLLEGLRKDVMNEVLFQSTSRPWRKTLSIPSGSPALLQILRFAPHPEARRLAYMGVFLGGNRQVKTLEQLLDKRDELARLTGHESFAHMTLKDKLAQTPEHVVAFLSARLNDIAPQLAEQSKMLLSCDRRNHGHSDLSQPGTLQPWDREYLIQHYTARSQPVQAGLASFFTVGTVFSGLSRLWQTLFGIHLRLETPAPGETWHEGVLKLQVCDEDAGGVVGTIYADLWDRPGKPAGAAHFTVRCSRRVDLDDVEGDIPASASANDLALQNGSQVITPSGPLGGRDLFTGQLASTKDRQGQYQQPIVALLCNFRAPEHGTSAEFQSYLHWSEIETLYHEMGHALHSMVGRTEFQNVSGTRCATDFVEVPSILMEQFLLHPQVVPMYARHYRTGLPLPLSQIEAHTATARSLAALEMHDELLLSLLDQNLHLPPPQQGGWSGHTPPASTAVFESTHERYSKLPFARGLDWQGRFGHLASYPAAYYSYPLDRTIAQAVYRQLFAPRPDRPELLRESGDRYKHNLLAYGGGKKPWDLITSTIPNIEQEPALQALRPTS